MGMEEFNWALFGQFLLGAIFWLLSTTAAYGIGKSNGYLKWVDELGKPSKRFLGEINDGE